jgi:hypothetical protein
MALAQTRYRENYPGALEGVANTVRVSGNFTTAGGVTPTVKSSGPFSVTRTGAGTLVVTLTEPCVEFLSIDASLLGVSGNTQFAKVLSTGQSVGNSSTPASFTIETQSVAGTAGDLTGPIISFYVAYRKGALRNR